MRNEEYAMPIPSNNLSHGLTKRELFAAMLFQGLLANRDVASGWSFQHLAGLSVEAADSLMAKLAKGM